MKELEKMAVESDTQIFAAGLFSNPQTREEVDGPALLTQLCGRTGGLTFVIQDVAELHTVMAKIGVTLHNQYVLGYYPTNAENNPGKYRKIKVLLLLPTKLPLQIHARSGYYLPQ